MQNMQVRDFPQGVLKNTTGAGRVHSVCDQVTVRQQGALGKFPEDCGGGSEEKSGRQRGLFTGKWRVQRDNQKEN